MFRKKEEFLLELVVFELFDQTAIELCQTVLFQFVHHKCMWQTVWPIV